MNGSQTRMQVKKIWFYPDGRLWRVTGIDANEPSLTDQNPENAGKPVQRKIEREIPGAVDENSPVLEHKTDETST